ncbi:MAG TPA: glycosyltransferase family 39 protein [Pyrinomonadaceae bacterium]|nr:glycosyltransferase family 39 protein [Pyrinomonadaceae bacterium]
MPSASKLPSSILLWLGLRVGSVAVVLLAFYFRPVGVGIRAITSITTFALLPWYVWDVNYYVEIVKHGYQAGAATANFHPLYPWIAKVVAMVVGQPLVSLLLVASVAGLLLTVCFYRLARLDVDNEQAWKATALMLVWPASVALFIPYTESLFLLLSVYCLFAARQRNFWLAGLAGALATLTRQQGLFLALPLAWEIWETEKGRWSRALKKSLPVLLVPAAYAGWVVYRAIAINDVHPDFSSVQKFIHTVMISPTSYDITDQHAFLPPWSTLYKGMNVLLGSGASTGVAIDAALSLVFIGLFVLSWREMRMSYRIYSVVIILVALSFYAGDVNPFLALPRHLLLAFPVFIGLAARYRLQKFSLVLVLLVVCQAALLCTFVWQTWVP